MYGKVWAQIKIVASYKPWPSQPNNWRGGGHIHTFAFFINSVIHFEIYCFHAPVF